MDEECSKKDRVMLLREEQNWSHQATHFAGERSVVWFYYIIEVSLFFWFLFPPPKLYLFVRFSHNKHIFS